jgi:glycosyltransferase involved in cell wall biosynthesis
LSIPAFFAGFFWRAPLILNVADLWPDVILDGGFMEDGLLVRCLYGLERWCYKRAAYVNAVTDWIAKILREKKSIPEEKILFLPNGVDIHRFQPKLPDESLKSRLSLSGKQIVLWAGTLGYAHGLDNVLRAAKLLEPRAPDIHFLFVGDGSARERLIRLKAQLALGNVSFHDPVSHDEIVSYYSIAFCGLASLLDIPTYRGARPSKIFPVFASAKPLIFVGRGETADLVRQADAGMVVPPGDPQSLANVVLDLAQSPHLARTLGENGRRFVEDNLQWSTLVERWLKSLRPEPLQNVATRSSISLSQ